MQLHINSSIYTEASLQHNTSLLHLHCLSSSHASRLISSPFPSPVRDHVQCSRSDTCHFGHFNRPCYLLTYLLKAVLHLFASSQHTTHTHNTPMRTLLHWLDVTVLQYHAVMYQFYEKESEINAYVLPVSRQVGQLNHIITKLTESFDEISKRRTRLNILQTNQHLNKQIRPHTIHQTTHNTSDHPQYTTYITTRVRMIVPSYYHIRQSSDYRATVITADCSRLM